MRQGVDGSNQRTRGGPAVTVELRRKLRREAPATEPALHETLNR
jgi:hypothetical protein